MVMFKMAIFVGVEEEKDSEKKVTILHPIRPDLRSQLEKEQEERTSGTRPILIIGNHTIVLCNNTNLVPC